MNDDKAGSSRLTDFPRLGPDRLPPLADIELTQSQRRAAAELAGGPRGAVVGPFIPALRSPEFMQRLEKLGSYLRFENALGARLTEFVILLTARRWNQAFEWSVHARSAARQGIGGEIIDAIRQGAQPAGLTPQERVAYELFNELDVSTRVSDRVYARAVAAFGEQGVIDLIGTIGYYTMLAMILNVAQTPLPDDPEALIVEAQPVSGQKPIG
jgi:4-carboxymuconolactone decarboxylase